MTDTRWTPGPWRYRPSPGDDWGTVRGPITAGNRNGWPVAYAREGRELADGELDQHRKNGTDPWEANARLIAAAPDLYAALAAILPWHDPHPIEATDNPIINQCRAALAKARGESR